MGMIDEKTMNMIREKTDIVDVISSNIPLSPKGKNFFGVCPFHDDSNPSMCVSKEKQIYTCFSCHETGNVFKFLMEYEHITFQEAVKKCADMVGINLNIGPVKLSNSEKYKELYEIYEVSSKFYQNNLKTSMAGDAREYLNARGITDEIVKEFGIGLALKERNLLTKLLFNKKYSENDLLRSGLVNKNEYGLNDIYYNRIMFPLTDLLGKVIGYSGRIYSGEDNTSKYINTRETEIFKKGEILYNYHRAKEECRKTNSVIVMEGFMDIISAYVAGVKNTIAPMGTAVTKEQALLIKKLAPEVILCFDGDSAGQKATISCSDELQKLGVTPKVIMFDDGVDPDDYIKSNGIQEFIEKINNPISIMDFKLLYLKKNKNLDNAEDMASYVNEIIIELNKIKDEVLKEITIKKVCEESGLDVQFLKDKLIGDAVKKVNEPIEPPLYDEPIYEPLPIEVEKPKVVPKKVDDRKIIPRIVPSKQNPDKYLMAEQGLLFYMLKSKEVVRMYNNKVKYLPTGSYYHLAIAISNFYDRIGHVNVADLITSLGEDTDTVKTIGEILALDFSENYSIEEINDYINAIRECNMNAQINRLMEKMSREKDPIKKAKLVQEMQVLKRGENND